MVFDKTGTLTYGKPEVNRVVATVPESTLPLQELVAILGLAESSSEHPLGIAISGFAKKVHLHVFTYIDVHVCMCEGVGWCVCLFVGCCVYTVCVILHINITHQALGEDLRGSCVDYHAEPGLGLSCSVQLSALPNTMDPSVEAQCVRIACVGSNSSQPLVSPAHSYQVHTQHALHTHLYTKVHMHMSVRWYTYMYTMYNVQCTCI